MRKRYTDVPYEVVSGPTRERKELPAWFKVALFALVGLMLAARGVWSFNEAHRTPPTAAAAPVAPQSPDAR